MASANHYYTHVAPLRGLNGGRMKTVIDTKSRDEGNAIKTGLDNPMMRAATTIVGVLSPLSVEQRATVLKFVDAIDEPQK